MKVWVYEVWSKTKLRVLWGWWLLWQSCSHCRQNQWGLWGRQGITENVAGNWEILISSVKEPRLDSGQLLKGGALARLPCRRFIFLLALVWRVVWRRGSIHRQRDIGIEKRRCTWKRFGQQIMQDLMVIGCGWEEARKTHGFWSVWFKEWWFH